MKQLSRFALALILMLLIALAVGCSVQHNTASTRFYHNLTTRYNVYYNGANAFDQSYASLLENFDESYTERLSTEPILRGEAAVEKNASGGPFDAALEKGRKAIRMHSIRTKPQQARGRASGSPFYRKREYNTFIYNAWLLVGKSQYYNGDFLDAMATFSYMARLYREEPEIRSLARLWQARCYTALGWTTDAERTLALVDRSESNKRKGLYDITTADIALLKDRPEEAIAPLKQAVKYEKDARTRVRLRFLLGQLQRETGNNAEAKRSFGKVVSAAPPFPIEVAARLNLIDIEATGNAPSAIRKLHAMQHKGRYKTVVDRVSYTKGLLHLNANDTTKAIEAFTYGMEHSTDKKHAYALNAITLAELYLAKNDFIKAAETLDQGIAALERTYPRYEELSRLSKNLDNLALNLRSVKEQDSLRLLASLPEPERLRIIDSAITAYKKQQREEQRTQQMEEQRERSQAFNDQMGERRPDQTLPAVGGAVQDKSFYFYNPQLIERGKALFKKDWGNRPLEDDWQRRNKRIVPGQGFAQMEEPAKPNTDTIANSEQTDSLASEQSAPETEGTDESTDPTKRAYYLAQLPFTKEALAAGDAIIQTGLSNAGAILNEEMEFFAQAISVYTELLNRYPEYSERLNVYYTLYMICTRLGRADEAARWCDLMLRAFPNEALTKEVSNPDYIASLRNKNERENALYQTAYDAYFSSNADRVLSATDSLLSAYPLSELRAKTLFLQGLAYALRGDARGFSDKLSSLVDEFSNDEAALVARDMLAELKSGRKLVPGEGYSGLDYSSLFASQTDSLSTDSLIFGLDNTGTYHALLLVSKEIDRNALLFSVAAFNFAQYTDYPMDFTLEEHPEYLLIDIAPIPSRSLIRDYLRQAYAPEGYMNDLPQDALLIPIIDADFKLLKRGRSLAEYLDFLADSLISTLPEAAIALERYAEQMNQKEEQPDHTEQSLPSKAPSPARTVPIAHKTHAADSAHVPQPADTSAWQPVDTLPSLAPDTVTPLPTDTLAVPTDTVVTPSNEPITIEEVDNLRADRLRAERKEAKKQKEALRKAEAERKAALKAREQERREKERLRKEQRKQREKERREKERQRRQQTRQKAPSRRR